MGANDNDFLFKVFKSSYIGVSQVVLTFIASHPFDLMKTRLQAQPDKTKPSVLFYQISKTKGVMGFHTGGIANFSRAVVKEAYRNPVRGIFKSFYTQTLPQSVQIKYPEARNLTTGLTIAVFDTFILCPLERMKVWIMTSEKDRSIRGFIEFRSNQTTLLEYLFKGLNVSFVRSAISWSSYLIIEEDIRRFITRRNMNNDISISQQIIIGFFSGSVNSFHTLPFDAIKTHMQKYDSYKDESTYGVFRHIIETHGVKALYAGWTFRLPSYIIVALITSQNIQKIDKIWNVEAK